LELQICGRYVCIDTCVEFYVILYCIGFWDIIFYAYNIDESFIIFNFILKVTVLCISSVIKMSGSGLYG
jgi:hypothetical protein